VSSKSILVPPQKLLYPALIFMLGLTHDFDQCKEFAGRDSLPCNCSAIEAARHKEKKYQLLHAHINNGIK
jgi:hypothetical protein